MVEGERYSPEWTSAFYDQYGEQEWERFARHPASRVNLYIHTHYLRQHVRPGARVLEVGAGPGRFTQVLADLGCRVVVTDLSPVQLDLHRKHARELGFEEAVESRHFLDVCDLSSLASDSFDIVLCYGGPLSYVFGRAAEGMRECVRKCRPGGRVLASVMSLWGTCERYLAAVLQIPTADNRRITDTGDLTPANWEAVTHRCHMFRAREFRALAEGAGLKVVAMSASNCLSAAHDQVLGEVREDSAEWQELLRMELEACSEAGCLDMGTHIVLVGVKA